MNCYPPFSDNAAESLSNALNIWDGNTTYWGSVVLCPEFWRDFLTSGGVPNSLGISTNRDSTLDVIEVFVQNVSVRGNCLSPVFESTNYAMLMLKRLVTIKVEVLVSVRGQSSYKFKTSIKM